MARPIQYTSEQIEQALKGTHGLISLAAERLGCSYNTINNRVKRNKKLKAVINHYRKKRVDVSELALDRALANGEPWAVSLVLKTLGKSRGYVERSEVTGAKGGPIQTQDTTLSPAERERAERELNEWRQAQINALSGIIATLTPPTSSTPTA